MASAENDNIAIEIRVNAKQVNIFMIGFLISINRAFLGKLDQSNHVSDGISWVQTVLRCVYY